MYNQELKERFISQQIDIEHTRTVIRNIFKVSEPVEIAEQKDFCALDAEKINEIFKKTCGLKKQTSMWIYRIIKKYCEWCIENEVDGASREYEKINYEDAGIEKIRGSMVSNPLHLQKVLDKALDEESLETMDNAFRCYFWLAFMGCPEDLAFDVTTKNVDFENMVIKIKDKDSGDDIFFPIYRESIPAFKNCVNLQEFRFLNPVYREGTVSYISRVPGNQLLRGIKTQANKKAFREKVARKLAAARAKDSSILNISYDRLWLSGLFYRQYQEEMSGMIPDFSDAALEHIKGKEYRLYGKDSSEATYQRFKRRYLEEYIRWKIALIK